MNKGRKTVHRMIVALICLWLLAGCGGTAAPVLRGEDKGQSATAPADAWVSVRDALLEQFAAAVEEGDPRPWCAALISAESDSFETCVLSRIGNGRILLLRVVTGCGGDSCDVEGYIRTAATDHFDIVDIAAGGTVEATPDGRSLLFDTMTDQISPTAEDADSSMEAPPAKVVTRRLHLETGAVSLFSTCFSPRLSPGGRWIVCRNEAADVLRIPPGGGSLETVALSGFAPAQIVFVPYAWQWPEPVEFTASDRLIFSVMTVDADTLQQQSISWQE